MSFSGGSKLRWMMGAMLSAALVASSASPAMAQGRGGYNSHYGWGNSWGGSSWRGDRYGHRPYRHRDRGMNAGDVIGIAALIGAVAVIASSASKNKREKQPEYQDYPYPDYPQNGQGGDAYPYPAPNGPATGGNAAWSSDSAIDSCISAVRVKAESERGYAEVVDVAEPRVVGNNGWSIDGRVQQRSSYRSNDGQTRRFTCDVRDGQVAEVYLSRDLG